MLGKLVSIIVPCYNQGQYLPDALNSVLAQTYPHWECVIVNDGSPDNTGETAKQFCEKDPRFIYVNKKNGGISSARNAGLHIIKGDFIQFLDSDDMLEKQKLEKQIAAFNQDMNLDISVTNYYCFDSINTYPASDEWNNIIGSDFHNDILFRWDCSFSIPIHSALIKTEFIKNIKFNEQLSAQEDWLFWAQISHYSPCIRYLNEPLALYRINSAGSTQNRTVMQTNTIKALFLISEGLSNSEKQKFSRRTEKDILKILEDNYMSEMSLADELKRIRTSKAYRLGKFIIKPLSVLKKKLTGHYKDPLK